MSKKYFGSAEGYGGDVTAKVEISESGKLLSVELAGSYETKGIGDRAMEALNSKFAEMQTWDVDAVSGATITSTAAKNDTVNAGESIKSKIPPIPGNREPLSLTAKPRLIREPAKSPATLSMKMQGINTQKNCKVLSSKGNVVSPSSPQAHKEVMIKEPIMPSHVFLGETTGLKRREINLPPNNTPLT